MVFGLGLLLVALSVGVQAAGLLASFGSPARNYAAAAAWLAWRAGAPWLRPWSLRRIAAQFEISAGGQFDERILFAVEMAQSQPPGVSSWMVGRTIALAAEENRHSGPAGLVDSGPAKRAWKGLVGLCLVLGLACLLPGFAPRARLALYPYAPAASLSRTQLAVAPGDCRLRRGAPLEIKVTAETALDQAKLLIIWEDGFQESVLMTRGATNGFVVNLPAVSQGFRYFARAGDAETPSSRSSSRSRPESPGCNCSSSPRLTRSGPTAWPKAAARISSKAAASV